MQRYPLDPLVCRIIKSLSTTTTHLHNYIVQIIHHLQSLCLTTCIHGSHPAQMHTQLSIRMLSDGMVVEMPHEDLRKWRASDDLRGLSPVVRTESESQKLWKLDAQECECRQNVKWCIRMLRNPGDVEAQADGGRIWMYVPRRPCRSYSGWYSA
jgi:hypothetical protein